jgi:hypothetical protein
MFANGHIKADLQINLTKVNRGQFFIHQTFVTKFKHTSLFRTQMSLNGKVFTTNLI